MWCLGNIGTIQEPHSWFSRSHVRMWQLDHKEGWGPKNWCFQTVVLETTLESPLDCKEIKPVHPKGNQSWIFTGRTDAEAAAPCFGHLMMRRIHSVQWKRSWRWERLRTGGEGATEDEIVGWHHGFSGHKFEQTLGDSEGQGSLACCSPWGRNVSDKTEQLNN